MKPLSEQLADLSTRAKAAEDAAAAAQTQQRAQIAARVDQIQSDANARLTSLEHRSQAAEESDPGARGRGRDPPGSRHPGRR